MIRKVFFSFHYENDVWRTNIVRNSWVTKPDTETAGFIDAVDFEKIKKGGEAQIKRWIDEQLLGTTVTAVLIGAETSDREYVKYELAESWKRGNGILGIYIHQLRGKYGEMGRKGSDSFGPIFKSSNDSKVYFYERFKTYDWVDQDGYENLGKWVQEAATQAKK